MSLVLSGLVVTVSLLGGLFGGGQGSDCRSSATVGAQTMDAIVKEWPLRLAADPVRRYVRNLGQRLARTADPSGGGPEWRFFVVRNLEPTAFAVGGRRFIISDGLIAFVRNESDLAAVLAHEIAHQRLGHFCQNGGAEDRSRFHYGSIVQHFNLGREQAADAQAVDILATAGFDPESMYQVLRCLAERPRAPIKQLADRMRALESIRARWSETPRSPDTEFEQIRELILNDLDVSIRRCK